MNKISFYTPEKKPNALFTIFWISVCFSFIFCVSYFYSFFISVMPIVYFCIVITVGFGLFIGYLVRFSSKLFVITEKKHLYIVALLSSSIGIYFSWIGYVLLLNPESLNFYFFHPTTWFQAETLIHNIATINEFGLWGFFGANLTGFPLSMVWIGEALMIYMIPLALIKGYHISPFSTKNNKWYRKYELNKQFQTILNIPVSKEKIATNPIDYFNSISIGETNRHSIINIYFLEEEEAQYINAINLRYDREGKIINKEIAIKNQKISKVEAKRLLSLYHAKKSFFFD